MRVAPETAKKVRIFAAIDESEPSSVIAEAIDLLVRERLGEKGAAQLDEFTAHAGQN
jgi:hypothetical protein